MFIGHFGVGLGAKRIAPAVSLGTLFLGAQLLDLLWPTFLLLDWEQVSIEPGITIMAPLNFTDYPISHSLLMACVWGVAFGIVYYLFRQHVKGAIVLGCCVVSHWLLDLLVHRPDLPLYPGNSPLLGLGLWNHPVAEIILEGLIFVFGLAWYLRTTEPINKKGGYVFWVLIALLVLIHVMNLFGSPPPNTTAIAWAGELQWLFILLAWWADKNRQSKNLSPAVSNV